MSGEGEGVVCEGPLIWFSADTEDSAAVLECAAQGCGYIIATGSFHDAAHSNADILREGLAQGLNTATITADLIVTGNRIITASRKRPVEIIGQLSAPENADYFEFTALATNGRCALRLHRSETVELVLS